MTLKYSNISIGIIFFICLLPAFLNLLGIDFASEKNPLSSSSIIDGSIKADDLFYALAGALHHALLEWSAVSIAILIMIVSFIHYSVHKDITVPIIGVALLSAGLVDAFHTLAATRIIEANAPNTDFIPFTWALSRTFNAGIMIFGALISIWISRNSHRNIDHYGLTIIGTLSFIFVGIAYIIVHSSAISDSLPQTMYPDSLITRPFDVLPLSLFFVGGILFWSWYKISPSIVKFALVLSTIPEIATQIHMAFGSIALFDNHFNIAHSLKIIAYLTAFIGILLDSVLPIKERIKINPKNSTADGIKKVGYAKFPIAIKIPIAVFLVTIGTASLVGTAYHSESRRVMMDEQLLDIKKEGKLLGVLLNDFYDDLYGDVIFLNGTPPVSKIMEAYKNNDEKEKLVWIGRLETVFSTMLYSNSKYTQIRYIGVEDDGKEIIRVERKHNEIIVSPTSQLQKKGNTKYFKSSISFNKKDVYFSNIELNRERGEISLPHMPVIRASIPIYDEKTKNVFGIIIINVNYNKVVKSLEEATPEGTKIYLANINGDFLMHPDRSKAFGFDVGKSYKLQNEFPSLTKFVNNNDVDITISTIQDITGRDRLGYYTTFSFDEAEHRQILRLLLKSSGDEYFNIINSVRDRSIILGLSISIIVLAIAIFASRRLTGPLSQMTEVVREYEQTGIISNLPVDSKDEIGVLARAFQNMLIIIEERTSEINASAARIQAVLETAADAIITINAIGRIQSFNNAAEEMFGYKENEVIGKNVNMLMPNPYHEEHDSYLEKYITTGLISILGSSREVQALRKNGEIFPMDLSISEVNTDGERLFTGFIRDISERKESEEMLLSYAQDLELKGLELEEAISKAEAANVAKSDFLANMSHEIRTPMNGVIGTVGLMLKTDLNTQQHDYAKIIKNSGEALLELINDILDFSKIEAGKMTLEEIPIDLEEIIIGSTNMVRPLSEDKNLELLVNYPLNIDRYAIGDPARIRQVLLNLLSNAIKFTDTGHILLNVELDETNDNKLHFRISVEDTGIGIPENKLDVIFKDFNQADTSTTRKYGGTGLGLSICRHLANMMRGSISVKSEINKGSSFIFDIILAKDDNIVEKNTTTAENIKDKNILVVDDYALSLSLLVDMFKQQGMRVKGVSSNAEALTALEEAVNNNNPFNYMITDNDVPDINSIDFIKNIKSLPKLKDTIAILTSHSPKEINVEELQNIGIAAFIRKPVPFSTTIKILDEILKAKQEKYSLPILTPDTLIDDLHDNDESGNKDFSNVHVLLVDDDAVNIIIGTAILEDDFGCTVTPAGNGIEAIDQFKTRSFDLIFMDCQMPIMGGFEASQAIRDNEKLNNKERTPIIAFTANAMTGDKEKCLNAGMDDYITKPVKPEYILGMLQKWTENNNS